MLSGNWIRTCLTSVMLLASFGARADRAQGVVEGVMEYAAANELPKLSGDTMFAEELSLFDGSTRFSNVDISIPGNSSLPVELRRVMPVIHRRGARFDPGLSLFRDWNIDIPHISGTFYKDSDSKTTTWSVRNISNGVYGAGTTTNRCSTISIPPVPPLAQLYFWNSFWNGNYMNIPGNGSSLLLENSSTGSATVAYKSTYPWVTKSGWMIGCLSSTKNSYPGEGFYAIAPDGTKYTFDIALETDISAATVPQVSQMPAPGKMPSSGEYEESYIPQGYLRSRVYMLVSRIEDVHGNWVQYDYGSPVLSHINISSNDGRYINVHVNGNSGNVDYVQSSIGTWNYSYGKSQNPGGLTLDILSSVTRPDGSAWKYAAKGDLYTNHQEETDSDDVADCPEPWADGIPYTYTITHPSGAVGSYYFEYVGLSRVNIPNYCYKISRNLEYLEIPMVLWNYSLLRKEVSGPGIDSLVWTYKYSAPKYGLFAETCASNASACNVNRVATVTKPDSTVESHTFGAKYGVNEGFLLSREINSGGSVKSRVDYTYVDDTTGAQSGFPNKAGRDITMYPDSLRSEKNRPVVSESIFRDGRTFERKTAGDCGSSKTNLCFDGFGRPTKVIKTSKPTP